MTAAREQSLEEGVRFGQLERMQAAASPSLRGTVWAARAWTTLKAVLPLLAARRRCATGP